MLIGIRTPRRKHTRSPSLLCLPIDRRSDRFWRNCAVPEVAMDNRNAPRTDDLPEGPKTVLSSLRDADLQPGTRFDYLIREVGSPMRRKDWRFLRNGACMWTSAGSRMTGGHPFAPSIASIRGSSR